MEYKNNFPFELGTKDGKKSIIACCDDLREYFLRELNINPYDFPFGKETRDILLS